VSAALALVLERPGYAPWLLLAPLLLWLARRAQRPPEVPIGTFALWQDVQELHGAGARARARVPAWAWWAALALACAALAALGPRGARTRAPRTWSVVVDLSPSMHLALDGRTRLDAALAQAEELLAAQLAPADRVRWQAPGRAALELGPRARPGAAWLVAEARGEPEPEWGDHDLDGTLWVTDRVPAVARARAWVCASGGPAVAGAIAGDGATLVHVGDDGRARAAPAPSTAGVVLRGELPPVLVRAVRAWAGARGYALGGHADESVLVLEPAGAGEARAVTLGGNGWSARASARVAGAAEPGEQELWFAQEPAGGAAVVLRGRTGRLRVFLAELQEPSGDPAAFALACGQLFDALARPRPEVVALGERAAAGPAALVRGTPPQASGPGADAGPLVSASLAGLAVLGTLLAARSARRAPAPPALRDSRPRAS